jgi:P27 family predicted phage terminase small subunit
MRGRKPKPTVVKKLNGNPGKRRPSRTVAAPPAISAAEPPSWLSEDARLEWHRLVQELRQLSILTALDLGALAAYCSAWGDFVEAEREIRKSGAVVKSRDRGSVRSPWVLIRNKAREQVVKIGAEFGLSPSSRPRVGHSGNPLPPVGETPGAQGDDLDRHLASYPRARLIQ